MASVADVSKKSSKSNGLESHGIKLVKSFVETIDNWDNHQKHGIPLCYKIVDHKLEYADVHIEAIVARLAFSVNEMKALVDNMKLLSGQLQAFAKLNSSADPLINTWSATKLATEVENIFKMFIEETNLKTFIGENIAHCDDENLIEVYKSAWQFNTQLNEVKVELLKQEVS